MKRVLKTRVALLLLLAACGRARVIEVPSDYPTIQAGIDASADGDTVLVAAGTYTGEGNRDIDFKGKAINVESENGPQTCIIDCQGSKDDPHRGFFFHTGEDANSVLQGFTITNGYTRGRGGGISCDESSPSIENCTLTTNVALFGGGIACTDSNSVIANCIISDNIATVRTSNWLRETYGAGGGICLASRSDPGPMVINCIVSGNRASEYGGGIVCGDNSVISNCTIYGNRTGVWGVGGGISNVSSRSGYSARVRNCIIWGNTARGGEQIGCRLPNIILVTILNLSHCSVQNDPNAVSCPPPFIEGHWTSKEPLFANPGYWIPYEPNHAPPGLIDYLWIEGDYHLKSQAGRWDPNSQSWIQDDVTSACIDAGDPNSPIGHEPFPNGGIINMGAYGGTVEASKSYFDKPP